MKRNRVVYDSLNKLVFVEDENRQKYGTTLQKTFGKSAKQFNNNSQARAYAFKLAKNKGVSVYDEYFGETVKNTEYRKPTQKQQMPFFFGRY